MSSVDLIHVMFYFTYNVLLLTAMYVTHVQKLQENRALLMVLARSISSCTLSSTYYLFCKSLLEIRKEFLFLILLILNHLGIRIIGEQGGPLQK